MSFRSFNPCGPLNFSSKNEFILNKFMCSASDLLFIHHKCNNIPIFAMASCEGVIVHFLLVQREMSEVLVIFFNNNKKTFCN